MPPAGPSAPPRPDTLARLAPTLFVLLWATGFVAARLVASHADPLTFLWVRFLIATAVLALAAWAARAPWPQTRRGWRDGLVAGVLLHGVYLGGVFWAIKHGLPAGVAALIAGLQPLATGLLVGPLLGERVSVRRWFGIGVGFLGAALVIMPKLGATGGLPPASVTACFLGMLSMTLGTIWQKRTGGATDLRTNTATQYLGAIAVTLPASFVLGESRFDASAELWFAMAWAVVVLSIGAVGLLMLLLRRGAVAGVAALLYLVPPVAAVLAYLLFEEALDSVQIAGMAVAASGVALASRG